jgi:hypothetical protein
MASLSLSGCRAWRSEDSFASLAAVSEARRCSAVGFDGGGGRVWVGGLDSGGVVEGMAFAFILAADASVAGDCGEILLESCDSSSCCRGVVENGLCHCALLLGAPQGARIRGG